MSHKVCFAGYVPFLLRKPLDFCAAALISSDLVVGSGDAAVQSGDTLEIYYTGWLIKDGAISKASCRRRAHSQDQFDGNVGREKPFRFKIGKGKVIAGWDQGRPAVRARSHQQGSSA